MKLRVFGLGRENFEKSDRAGEIGWKFIIM